ncbi:hypothetical protein ElyMa_006520500 [Elysia marginata]|uniref:Uncharacterized protein n=1 Tax=Elysia marginata TaxID=1093978 RepID=A0AAV4I7K3_9GAST|nr:hypothetical protein ElyMa_006520500 [Elysia marginata]
MTVKLSFAGDKMGEGGDVWARLGHETNPITRVHNLAVLVATRWGAAWSWRAVFEGHRQTRIKYPTGNRWTCRGEPLIPGNQQQCIVIKYTREERKRASNNMNLIYTRHAGFMRPGFFFNRVLSPVSIAVNSRRPTGPYKFPQETRRTID